MTNHHPVTENFSLDKLRVAQHSHDIWSRIIYALESGGGRYLPALPVSFRQFFLSDERVLCRYRPSKKQAVAKFVVPERFIPTVLKLVRDAIIAGHPGREHTLTTAHTSYFWPTMCITIGAYVSKCVYVFKLRGRY